MLIYQGPTGVAAITHNGASNFAVKSYAEGSTFPDLLVNEISNYSGSVPLPRSGRRRSDSRRGLDDHGRMTPRFPNTPVVSSRRSCR